MLDVSQTITEVKTSGALGQLGSRMGVMLDKIVSAVNQVAQVSGVDSTGFTATPNPPQALNIKAADGLVHATIQDGSNRSRAREYFLEYANEPGFSAPHVQHLGVGRHAFINLPAKNDSGVAQPWYFRTYSMDKGSKSASPKINYGGSTPTAVSVGGTIQLTPLASTGAGTAPTNGQRGGQGFGTDQFNTGDSK
jgi:hypothetical protein